MNIKLSKKIKTIKNVLDEYNNSSSDKKVNDRIFLALYDVLNQVNKSSTPFLSKDNHLMETDVQTTFREMQMYRVLEALSQSELAALIKYMESDVLESNASDAFSDSHKLFNKFNESVNKQSSISSSNNDTISKFINHNPEFIELEFSMNLFIHVMRQTTKLRGSFTNVQDDQENPEYLIFKISELCCKELTHLEHTPQNYNTIKDLTRIYDISNETDKSKYSNSQAQAAAIASYIQNMQIKNPESLRILGKKMSSDDSSYLYKITKYIKAIFSCKPERRQDNDNSLQLMTNYLDRIANSESAQSSVVDTRIDEEERDNRYPGL